MGINYSEEKQSSSNIRRLTVVNSIVNLSFYLLSRVVAFFFRSYFISILGKEIPGLNGIIVSIIGFLNLAELGLSSAIGFSLYEPISKNDKKTIAEIIALQKIIYRYIALIITVASGILLFFFPFLLSKQLASGNIPFWYAYATFGVLLINNLLGYLFNYRQVLPNSDMHGYIITLITNIVISLKMLLQIFFMLLLRNESTDIIYISWLLIEGTAGILMSLSIELVIHFRYPWLRIKGYNGKELLLKHSVIIKKTGQLVFHKISSFIMYACTPLVINAVMPINESLYMNTVYQNYMMLHAGILGILSSILGVIIPTIGNLKASGTSLSKLERDFRGLSSIQLWIASICCLVLFLFSKDFMDLWVGKDMYFDKLTLIMFIIYSLLQFARVFDYYLSAFGLFKDVWAPVVEASLNLGLSLLLGYQMGFSGIFLGIIMSQIIIIYGWKPYFLYHSGFKIKAYKFFIPYSIIVIILCIVVYLFYYVKNSIINMVIDSWSSLVVQIIIFTTVYSILSFCVLLFISRPAGDFIRGVIFKYKK